MQNTLKEALRAKVTFEVENTLNNASKKLAFLPGVYSTMKPIVVTTGTGESAKTEMKGISYADPTNLQNAGYACDQVADDYNSDDTLQVIKVNGANRIKYRDFLNTVQRVGIRVTRIVIQNKLLNNQDIYDQEIELAKTAIGAKGGTDFINLQDYVSVNAFDRTKIILDFSDQPLELTPEVFMAMTIPASAKFSIQLEFESAAM